MSTRYHGVVTPEPPSQTHNPRPYRLTYVSPLDMAVVFAVLAVLGYVLNALLVSDADVGVEELLAWAVVALFSGLFGGLFFTILFNMVARRVGGIEIHLAAVPKPEHGDVSADADSAAVDLLAARVPTGARKECPSCGATIRAELSFCPECDHSFDDDGAGANKAAV